MLLSLPSVVLGAKRLGAKRLGGETTWGESTWGRNDLYSIKLSPKWTFKRFSSVINGEESYGEESRYQRSSHCVLPEQVCILSFLCRLYLILCLYN
jgi:hypothetical protein